VTGTLLADLSLTGSTVSGTLGGDADDGSGSSISVQGAVSGLVANNGTTVSGYIDGFVSLKGPHGSGGCTPFSWTLTPR
jgi:hypothetical protein